MSKYRYRESWGGGVTNRSLTALDKHLSKIGEVKRIKGYIYFGRYHTNHVGVMITGTLGTMRLGGFSWGYSGEGVRGTKTLLEKLNVSPDEVARIISIPWDGWNKTGLVWSTEPSS